MAREQKSMKLQNEVNHKKSHSKKRKTHINNLNNETIQKKWPRVPQLQTIMIIQSSLTDLQIEANKVKYNDIINFWFEELSPDQRFKADDALDLKMTEKFIALHAMVTAGEYSFWRLEPMGRLAEIIVIDQFSRCIYRDDAKSFINDPLALVLAQECIKGEHHKKMKPIHKLFLYMPFMHSESKLIHSTAVLLFSETGLQDNLDYELKHKEVIEKFGRFPHRNLILGRLSTKEEIDYLNKNGPILENETSWHHTNLR